MKLDKVIDSHQHFWRYNDDEFGWIASDSLRRDFLPTDYKAVSSARTVVVEARQCMEETQWLIDLAKEYDFIAGVVGWFDLRSPSIADEITRLSGCDKLVGVRHVVQDEPDPDFIVRSDFVRGVRHALAAGLAYDILIFQHQLPAALKFVDTLPDDARLVVDHFAKPKGCLNAEWVQGIKEMGKRENVFVKASGLVTEVGKVDFTPYLETLLEAFGPRRVMFGSDWPVVTADLEYSEWFETCCKMLPDECFAEVAKSFYNIKEK